MNHKKTMIALAITLMALIPAGMLMSDESDARVDFGDVWGSGFTTNGDGTLHVTLNSTEYIEIEMTITVTEGNRELKSIEVTIPAATDENPTVKYVAEVSFRLDGEGTHQLRVTCEPSHYFTPSGQPINYYDVNVDVTVSIWSNTTTYIAIIVVALLIVIAVYLKIRSTPITKPKMTFTELERQKAVGKEESLAEKESRQTATERRRYRSEGKAEKPAAAPTKNEEKPMTFTELEKQKGEKKEPVKKTEPSTEPKKLKYVSSRRK